MPAAPDSHQTSSDGSTLVEVLVAFVIVSMVVVASLQQFTDGVRRTSRAQESGAALSFARSKLAELELSGKLRPGAETGTMPPDNTWSVSVADIAAHPDLSPEWPAYWVSVEVRQADSGRILASIRSIIISHSPIREAE